jgi:hypothetical protein
VIESWWRQDFQHPSRLMLGPTQPPYNGYWVFFQGVKQPRLGIDQHPPSTAKVKGRVKLYFYSLPQCHHGLFLDEFYLSLLCFCSKSVYNIYYVKLYLLLMATWEYSKYNIKILYLEYFFVFRGYLYSQLCSQKLMLDFLWCQSCPNILLSEFYIIPTIHILTIYVSTNTH